MPVPTIDLTWAGYSLALLAAFAVGISKTGFGGASMVSVLLFAEIFGAKPSVGVALPLLIVADIAVYPVFRRYASWRLVWPLLPPAIAGVFVGAYLLGAIDNATARRVIGWIILVMLSLRLLRFRFADFAARLPHSTAFAWFCGAFGGIATTLANAAGPVMSVYLLLRQFPKFDLLGVNARFFLFINLFKVTLFVSAPSLIPDFDLDILNSRSLLIDLMLVPGVVVGILVGRKLLAVVPQQLFDSLLVAFALIAALRLALF
ncbi:sulfite exporter TauE/SafE family protein [soil metagenome]